MIFKNFKVLGILLLLLAVFTVGGKKVSAAVEDGDIQYTIGVVVYNQDSPEMNMFMNYYREYIQQGFPVKFYFSGNINSAEVCTLIQYISRFATCQANFSCKL